MNLQPALLQIQKAEMDSSDCVLLIVNQAQRNEYLATSNSAPVAIVRQFKGFGSKLISAGYGSSLRGLRLQSVLK